MTRARMTDHVEHLVERPLDEVLHEGASAPRGRRHHEGAGTAKGAGTARAQSP